MMNNEWLDVWEYKNRSAADSSGTTFLHNIHATVKSGNDPVSPVSEYILDLRFGYWATTEIAYQSFVATKPAQDVFTLPEYC
jgi:hypothetical protein